MTALGASLPLTKTPAPQAGPSLSASTSSRHRDNNGHRSAVLDDAALPRPSVSSLRATRSVGSLRTPHSSAEAALASALMPSSHGALLHPNSSGSSHDYSSHNLSNISSLSSVDADGSYAKRQHTLSLSPPPDLSFSRSSLHSDQEPDFLNRPGGSGAPYNQFVHSSHHIVDVAAPSEHAQLESVGRGGLDATRDHVRIVAGSSMEAGQQSDTMQQYYPYSQGDSWGSRTSHAGLGHGPSKQKLSANSRIRLDSVFGTQLPGFPYLNSAAAATSSALGHPVHSHHFMSTSSHNLQSSTSDLLLRGRSSYNWSERSHSVAAFNSHTRRGTHTSTRSATSMSQHNAAQQVHARSGSANGVLDVDTSCSGGSNSSDEVDLDLSFDMDVVRARQLQQAHDRQRQAHMQAAHGQLDQNRRNTRVRSLSHSSGAQLVRNHSKSGHVGIDMAHQGPMTSSRDSSQGRRSLQALQSPPGEESLPPVELSSEQYRRYRLAGKKRLSRSAVDLRAGRVESPAAGASCPYAPSLSASTARQASSNGSTPCGPTPIAGLDHGLASGYAARQSALSSTVRSDPGRYMRRHQSRTSRASLDLAAVNPLAHEEAIDMDDDDFQPPTSATMGWSFATTPPLSPAEIVTFAEGPGKGTSNGLERRRSSGNLLKKRRPSFPLMSLIDKAIRAPADMFTGKASSTPVIQSPESSPTWGSPTPRTMTPEGATADYPMDNDVPPVPAIPSAHAVAVAPPTAHEPQQSTLSSLAGSPAMTDDEPLVHPPALYDPAAPTPPESYLGSPGTMSPDLGTTVSGFSSPRWPDEIPTPKTGDFGGADGHRYSQFSLAGASSVAGTSVKGTRKRDSAMTEVSSGYRDSKVIGVNDEIATPPSPVMASHLEVIDEMRDIETDSPRKSTSTAVPARSPSSVGSSGPVANAVGQTSQGHKRQSSSLFRFPFISSLRNPFGARDPAASIVSVSPHTEVAAANSPANSCEELAASQGANASGQTGTQRAGKRSISPHSSEESHFQSSDPPSPPRPGATSRASAVIDPSMLRAGPNTGKGRLAGLGLSFASVVRRQSQASDGVMHQHHPQRQSSLPVLSFSAASDDQHASGERSVESEEAAIQVVEHAERPENSLVSTQPSPVRPRPVAARSAGSRSSHPASAPATAIHFEHAHNDLVHQMNRARIGEGAGITSPVTHAPVSEAAQRQSRRRRVHLLSHASGFDLRGRIDRMRPSQLLFLAAFLCGPWCFVVGGWALRTLDGDYRSVKGMRCRCPAKLDVCECQAEIYRQIKLSGGRTDLVLQMQNGQPKKMDRFVLANRVAALLSGTVTLVLAITALIVLGRAW